MIPYETFEHEADIGLRGFGASIEEAFSNAARAMYSIMLDVDAIQPLAMRSIDVSAPDAELLLVEWLNALLSLSDIERMVFSKFDVKIAENHLTGSAWGEPLDRIRHKPVVEIKGATYHMLSVKQEQGRYVAQCVVDV
jgi:SHS2 domain-containing protein